MKVLKISGLVLFLIIIIHLVIAIYLPKEMQAVRFVDIERNHREVFDYIKYLKNQPNYSKWQSIDPQQKLIYSGTDGQVGFIQRWESEHPDVGIGEQEIIAIEEGKRIDTELRFEEPFENTANSWMEIKRLSPESTKVRWGFSSKMPYPMNIMLLYIDMESAIADDFEVGLNRLKEILEN